MHRRARDPSVQQISDVVGLKSTASVAYHLEHLG
ncbi:LexA family protein [Streptomyces scabiei]